MDTKIPKWITEHNAVNEKIDAEPGKYFKFPEGETEILVDINTAPTELQKAGFDKVVRTRYQYNITVKGEPKILEVGKQLDRQIIKALMMGKNPLVVIRVGRDINSKYSVKGLG